MIEAGLRFRGGSVGREELERLHEQFLAFYADNIAVGSRPFEGIPELLDRLLGPARGSACAPTSSKACPGRCCEALGLATAVRRHRRRRHVRRVQAGRRAI